MISFNTAVLSAVLGLTLGNVGSSVLSSVSSDTSATSSTTDVVSDLTSMGVKASDYPKVVGSTLRDFSFMAMVEWGYTGTVNPSSLYCYYLYFYNPSCSEISKFADVTMSSLNKGESATDVSSYYSFDMDYCSCSSDFLFYKFRVCNSNATILYGDLDSSNRRYLIGNVTIKDLTGFRYSLPIGKETDFTGLCKDVANGVNSSTLVGALSPTVVVRAKVQPFVSDLGYFDFDPLERSSTESRNGLDSQNVLFSLPKSVDKYGTLDSCHYDYYRFRTNWIFSTSNKEDYDDIIQYCGKSILNSDGSYVSRDSKDSSGNYLAPRFGYYFPCYFDENDYDCFSISSNPCSRYFNDNNSNQYGSWSNRLDCPGWVFYDPHLVGSSISDNKGDGKDNVLAGKTMEDYFNGYGSHFSNNLPRRVGACSRDLVHIPSYSKDEPYCKYGHISQSVSRADLLGSAFSSLKNQLDYELPYYEGSNKIVNNCYDVFKEKWVASNSDISSYVFGDNQVSMLSSYSDTDFMVIHSFPSYSDSLSSFVSSNSGDNVYRLTYCLTKTSSNVCTAGKSSSSIGFWTAQNATASKTDVCLDFEFIDFTFKDENGKTYTLPASNDPFSTFGDVHQAYIPYLPTLLDLVEDSLSSWFKDNPWIWYVICGVLLLAVLVLCAVFPKVFKAFGNVFKVVADVLYVLLVWWWVAIICRISKKEVPRSLLFRFDDK